MVIPSRCRGRTAACLVVLTALPANAQDAPPASSLLTLTQVHHEITIDGRVTDEEWRTVPVLTVTMIEPDPGQPPSQRTEIRVAYDKSYFYASARMWDAVPGGVRARSLTRDRWTNDDTFEIILDTLNDNENAVKFMVMPAGTRQDALIWKDVEYQGDEWNNEAWNTIWDAATTITPDGWFAEIRVPFSSLRMRLDRGRIVMGLIAMRYIVRRNEIITFPTLPPNRRLAWFKPSLARDVILDGVDIHRPVYVTPYVLAGPSRSTVLNEHSGGYDASSSTSREAGADAKIGVGDNLTLDLTLNTDFAQIESDEEQLNLTRYSLFLPERRPFFLEREKLFDFNTGGQTGLFYSRRIGLSEAGEPVRIYGGARLTGRIGEWDVGAMNLQTEGTLPGAAENASVFRARQQISAQSHVGGIATSRLGSAAPDNVAYGIDSQLHLRGPNFLTVMWAQTPTGRGGAGANGFARVRLDRRVQDGWAYNTDVRWSGGTFNPALGFLQERDATVATGSVSHGWRRSAGQLLRYSFGLWAGAAVRNADRSLEYRYTDGAFRFSLRAGDGGDLSQSNQREELLVPFVIAPAIEVPPGRYSWHRVSSSFETRSGPPVRLAVSGEAGGFYDGRRSGVILAPTWSVGRHVELSSRYSYTRVTFPARNQRLDAHIAQLRARVGVTTQASFMTYLQYNSVRNAATMNFRFRYAVRDGTDLYVVYDEGLNTDRFRAAPVLPWSDRRAFAVKYAHTFAL